MRASASAEVVVKGFPTTTMSSMSAAAAPACREKDNLTMFATPHGFLRELCMVIGARADDDKLDVRVREEIVGGTIVFRIRVVNGAVLALLDALLVSRCFSALQESIHFEVSVWSDERQVEAFGGKAIAYQTNFDWCHGL